MKLLQICLHIKKSIIYDKILDIVHYKFAICNYFSKKKLLYIQKLDMTHFSGG